MRCEKRWASVREYSYIVTVFAETQDQANQVICERIDPDEDYGFDYIIEWRHEDEDMGT